MTILEAAQLYSATSESSWRPRFGIMWEQVVFGGMAGAFFLEKPPGVWPKIGIAFAGLVLGWICYSIASNILTYLHAAPDERR